MSLLDMSNVTKEYVVGSLLDGTRGVFKAMDDVTFSIGRGEIVGLVGESGSGKSTTARIAAGLLAPSFGEVELLDHPIHRRRLPRKLRVDLGFIFQNPYGSLNPRRSIGASIALPIQLHRKFTAQDVRKEVLDLLDRVGLTPADSYIEKMPKELSGGQRQRVAIARAIALKPKLLIADEPVSALDVTISSQILNLLTSIQSEIGSSILFISHDLDLVSRLCNSVLVMNRGRIVERGDAAMVLRQPQDEYTKLLVESMPTRLNRTALESGSSPTS
ncbi:ABC transporter ATP-binding protein [Nesterenkonia ebinurensis]|uniref:ABC transporter ATP-binding protein n=1 Tax=Nesterenkonia ebinurensis TaxID=2608252 RepID=UPI00123C7FC1|nr:ATP-binding cassette domain-containing protein [Nesterenkonia ebinurensis]